MRISIRRQLQVLHAYAAVTFVIAACLSISAFTRQPAASRSAFLDADGKTVHAITR